MTTTREIGDYHIIKQIGQGSLGTVYLVEHRYIKKQFVLKVLPEELSSDRSFVQRFEEEISLLAKLDHPNIVKIHNISYAQGIYFLVMDCIVDRYGETTNLSQFMLARGERLEEEELYQLLMQVAEALDHAHLRGANGKGVIHRGLKLNNILIGSDEGKISWHLSDFGLSRIIGVGAVLTRTYKMVAEALGIGATLYSTQHQDCYPTPSLQENEQNALHASFLQNWTFLAPEQKRLDFPQPVTSKVDVYAFGVLVYYLLMGEFPEGVFSLPSEKALAYQWNWDGLILSCLRKDIQNRPDQLVEVLKKIKGPQERFDNPWQEKSKNQEPPTPERFVCHPSEIKEDMVEVALVSEKKKRLNKNILHESKSHIKLQPKLQDTELELPTLDPDPAQSLLVDPSVKHYKPEKREIKDIEPLLTEMVILKGGAFMRGSNEGNRDEMPRHQIKVSSFAIDIHPVTNEQFVRFLEVLGGEKDSYHRDVILLRDSRIKRSGGKISIESGYLKHPVVGVTWYGAMAFAKWVGKRLPTEAEWEIAACGGDDTLTFPTGDDIEKSQSNFFSSDTTPVMSYVSNPVGLFDMAGNVYEWCYDWYGYNYYDISIQEPDNPQGPLQGVYRVLRGGCWKSLREDLRCSRRHRNNPGTVNSTYGFRCAADVELQQSA